METVLFARKVTALPIAGRPGVLGPPHEVRDKDPGRPGGRCGGLRSTASELRSWPTKSVRSFT